MNVLIPIVGLLVLILIHELGHFLVAKAVGARATRFSLGFPPAIVRVKKGDTEYCIGAIPLGGYVRIPGMTRPQGSDAWRLADAAEEARLRREHGRADVLGDAVGDLRAALDRGDLDAVHRLASITRTALDTDADLLDPTTLRLARKDVERLDEEAHAGAYWRLAVWRRIAVIAAGPLANVVAAVLILTAFYLGGVPVLDVSKKIEAVSASSPAATAGLRSDDRIVSVNGVTIASAVDVSPAIQKTAGGPVTLVVQRGGRDVTLAPATPDQKDGRWLLGFQLGTERVGTRTYDVPGAVGESVDRLLEATRGTLASFKDIVISDGRKDLTTPVGIVSQSSETVDEGYFPFVLAMISLALAILNLLPFLPLDGGHILFALIERFRGGRPVPRALIERASAVGIVLVLVLFAFGVTNDIDRLSAP